MSEELQSLLDRIEKDGVDKAKAKADEIIKEAEARAAKTVDGAKADAEALLKKAEEDSKVFEVRSRKALDQAARDVILSVERSVAAIFARIAEQQVAEALDVDTIRSAITSLIDRYIKAEAEGVRLDITLNEEQREAVTNRLAQKFQERLADGITIKGSNAIASGFKVAVTDKDVEHDFTGAAVAEALMVLLRKDLAAIVKEAADS
jgi:V/A-type H+-transporting ATPase subunit E